MELFKTKTIADALGVSRKTVLEMSKRGGWAYVDKNNTRQFVANNLPLDVRFAVTAFQSGKSVNNLDTTGCGKAVQNSAEMSSEMGGNNFINASDEAKNKAQFRAALIFEYNKAGVNVQTFLDGYNNLDLYPVLHKKLGDVSQPTFYRWLKSWKESGASGVTPKYGMARGGNGASLLDEERQLLRHFWLRDTQPSAMHAWRLMKANLPYSTCTYQTALRYLNSIPAPTAGYYRKGEGRFENSFLPAMEQDLTKYKSLDVAVSDHHCLDAVVLYKGELVRPWITTFQDLRSGKILGWCPSVKPSSLSITVAFYMMCIRYGVPKSLLFDNGKDYHSKWLNGHTETVKVLSPEGIDEEKEVEFEGMFSLLGCKPHFTRTYNGKSKARQERFFKTLGEYLAKDMGTYVGSDSRSRPEEAQLLYRNLNGKLKRNDVPDWSEFVPKAEAMLEYINDYIPATGVGMEGKTRTQVFNENLPPFETIKHPSIDLLQKALMKGEVRLVNRQGVTINKINFYHQDLFEFFGRKVKVYRSLVNPNEITCHTLDGEFICKAYANYFKESGNLADDIGRLTAERRTLTAIAVEGSGEVKADPAYETMVDVAANMYHSNQLDSVTAYLDTNDDMSDRMAAGNENIPAKKKKSSLKMVFDKDIN